MRLQRSIEKPDRCSRIAAWRACGASFSSRWLRLAMNRSVSAGTPPFSGAQFTPRAEKLFLLAVYALTRWPRAESASASRTSPRLAASGARPAGHSPS